MGQEKASYTLQLRASNPEDSALASLESRLSDLEVIFLPTLFVFQIYLSRLFVLQASVGLSNENFSVVCMETNKKDLSQVLRLKIKISGSWIIITQI